MKPGKRGLDFTSSLYLGLRHSANSLPEWESLTWGKPAGLWEPEISQLLGKAFANLQGEADGILYPSTLHLFWDLFAHLGKSKLGILIDEHAYPIGKWGTQAANSKRRIIRSFPHNNLEQLQTLLRKVHEKGCRPVILTDGWCTSCGKVNPLREYLALLYPFEGWLVVDDTQAIGILGKQPNLSMPYGFGGGGVLRWLNLSGERLIMGSSLAKAFGVPIAMLSGTEAFIKQMKADSKLRWHASPPSQAHLHAARKALILNQERGSQLRMQLWKNVRGFRHLMKALDLFPQGGIFPVQRIISPDPYQIESFYRDLLHTGIRVLWGSKRKEVEFFIRADMGMKLLKQFVEKRRININQPKNYSHERFYR